MSRFRGEYATEWEQTAAAVKEAAGNRCVRCGHPSGDRMFIVKDIDEAIGYESHCNAAVALMHDGRHRVLMYADCGEHCTHERDRKLRVLTVHHLDGHKANDAWWNLLALCQVCHLQIQAKLIPERPFLFKHSAWFVPYVCGFYAHYYGGVSITREEAEAEPDRWLRMGQPWLYEGNGSV